MIYSKWLDWPLAKPLLRRVDALLVHNEDVGQYAHRFQLDTIVLRDPLPNLTYTIDATLIEGYQLTRGRYVIVPWSFTPDEPIKELFEAIRLTPNVKFVMTWFAEKLPIEIRNKLPSNLVLTGYLDDIDFNAIFSQASAALVLTTREGTQPSAASEAIVLGVPLIVTDLQTTRKLYEDMPIYIENSVDGIRMGVNKALAKRDKCKANILVFKNKFGNRLENEICDVKLLLGLSDQDKEVSR